MENLIKKSMQVPQERKNAFLKQNLDNAGLVEFAILIGADVTAYDNYAIKFATQNEYVEVVKLLINAGADASANNNYPISVAFKNGHTKVVNILAEAGADINSIGN